MTSNLNICLWMMGILNFITILFLVTTIVLTQNRIAFAQEARTFLEELAVAPGKPEVRLVIVLGSYLLICLLIWAKRDDTIQGTP